MRIQPLNCRNCGAVNDEFATICATCGAFLQNPVKTLDLFHMLGLVISAPTRAFRRVTLAEHKNYAFAIQVPLGISYVFFGMMARRGGVYHETLLDVLLHIGVMGVTVGIALAFAGALIFFSSAKIFRSTVNFATAFGLFAYALVPILGLTVMLLPVELMTFGIYLFTSNPPPRALNPESWYALRIAEWICVGWATVLLFKSGKVGLRLPGKRSAGAVLLAVAAYAALVFWVAMNVPLMM